MSGNVRDWTSEMYSEKWGTHKRVFRGANYLTSSDIWNAGDRYYNLPRASHDFYGSRLSLYIQASNNIT